MGQFARLGVAVDEGRHRHAREYFDDPRAFGIGRFTERSDQERDDRAGRGSADAEKADLGLFEHIGVADERDAENAAALHDEVDVLMPGSVDDVGELASLALDADAIDGAAHRFATREIVGDCHAGSCGCRALRSIAFCAGVSPPRSPSA